MTTKQESEDWVYSEKVKEHFLNPRNFLMGDESRFSRDAEGIVGNPICGDQMKMFLKIKDDKIVDIKWKTYGCASAIAYCDLGLKSTPRESIAASQQEPLSAISVVISITFPPQS